VVVVRLSMSGDCLRPFVATGPDIAALFGAALSECLGCTGTHTSENGG
jgi:hypothetical protein